jgi:stearoyl-CoA desaturase (Delta-9 desaturase)
MLKGLDMHINSSAKMKINFILAFGLIVYWAITQFTVGGLFLGILSYATIGKLGGDIGMHRYFSHRSFKTNVFWDKIIKLASFMIGHGSMFLWTITHRAHHKDSDTINDPHSPRFGGFFRIFFRTWSGGFTPSVKYGKDLLRDKEVMWIHKHYFNLLETGFVNTFGHSRGYRNYATSDNSTNNAVLNILTLGNGMHNIHHKNPSAYTTAGKQWYEFDLMKYFINAIRT